MAEDPALVSTKPLNSVDGNRPPSAGNRNLAVGTLVAGARGTAIVGVNGMLDQQAQSRGNFGLNVQGQNGKLKFIYIAFRQKPWQ